MAPRQSRLVLQLLLGLAFSAVLIWLSMRKINLAEVGHALAGANWVWFVPACGITLLAFWIRAVRWGWMLKRVKVIPVSSLFAATMIGFAANNLLPARLGELVRPWALGASERISRSSVFATVIVERVIDMFYDRLLPGGYLLLGHSESLLNVSTAFELVHLREDLVYRKPLSTANPPLDQTAKAQS